MVFLLQRLITQYLLNEGEIGFFTAGIRHVSDSKVGDTITDEKIKQLLVLPGFKPSVPVVFCGLYPVDADDFDALKDSLSKLGLNDASFSFEHINFCCFRPWFPLWIFRTVTFRNHTRTTQ